jgi:hypothetical protein
MSSPARSIEPASNHLYTMLFPTHLLLYKFSATSREWKHTTWAQIFAHSTMAPRAATRKSKRSSSKSIAGQVASPIGSPRVPLKNSASITEETEKELLKVLLGPLGKVKRHYQVYDQNPVCLARRTALCERAFILVADT